MKTASHTLLLPLISLVLLLNFTFAEFAYSEWQEGQYADFSGSRSYSLFVPSTLSKNPKLVVALHGCLQNGIEFSEGIALTEAATKYGFYILAPYQSSFFNSLSCWNWFYPIQQHRDMSEAGWIIGLMDSLNLNVPRKDSFVTGLSAGGAEASVLLSCYPERFQGGLIHAGVSFSAAQNIVEGPKVMKDGPKRSSEETSKQAYFCSRAEDKKAFRPPSLTVIQGLADQVVHPSNAQHLFEHHTLLAERLARKQILTPVKSETKREGKRSFQQLCLDFDAEKCKFKMLLIEGLDHAWSGGKEDQKYVDPLPPSSTGLLLEMMQLRPKN